MHTGLAAAAVPGRRGFCRLSFGYRSFMTFQASIAPLPHGEIEPAVLRNKAAAESTVAEELIKHGEGVAAEFRMFLRKAVAAQSAVKERIGATPSAAFLLARGVR